MATSEDLTREIERIKAQFDGAPEKHLAALEGMIEQAARERLNLKRLNELAEQGGLIQVHPENASLQRALPVSAEIVRHAAAYTNIMDKLMKHLAVRTEDEGDGLEEFE